jgi:hypothetical protein
MESCLQVADVNFGAATECRAATECGAATEYRAATECSAASIVLKNNTFKIYYEHLPSQAFPPPKHVKHPLLNIEHSTTALH